MVANSNPNEHTKQTERRTSHKAKKGLKTIAKINQYDIILRHICSFKNSNFFFACHLRNSTSVQILLTPDAYLQAVHLITRENNKSYYLYPHSSMTKHYQEQKFLQLQCNPLLSQDHGEKNRVYKALHSQVICLVDVIQQRW